MKNEYIEGVLIVPIASAYTEHCGAPYPLVRKIVLEQTRTLLAQAYEEAAQAAESLGSPLNASESELAYDNGVRDAAQRIRALKDQFESASA